MASPPNPPSASNMPHNPADHVDLYVPGYPRLAYFFSASPRYFHLRRFSALSARLLLYRQHELMVLERKLLEVENKNYGERDRRRLYNKDFRYVMSDGETGEAKELLDLYKETSCALKEYGEPSREVFVLPVTYILSREGPYTGRYLRFKRL